MDQSITISGNLTREPELRFTGGGIPVVNLGVAVNNRYQVNGEWVSKVNFFEVIVWKQLAENSALSLTKGARVTVTGRMEQRAYETQAGDRKVVYELIAQEVAVSLKFATVTGIDKNAHATAPDEITPAPAEAPVEEPVDVPADAA